MISPPPISPMHRMSMFWSCDLSTSWLYIMISLNEHWTQTFSESLLVWFLALEMMNLEFRTTDSRTEVEKQKQAGPSPRKNDFYNHINAPLAWGVQHGGFHFFLWSIFFKMFLESNRNDRDDGQSDDDYQHQHHYKRPLRRRCFTSLGNALTSPLPPTTVLLLSLWHHTGARWRRIYTVSNDEQSHDSWDEEHLHRRPAKRHSFLNRASPSHSKLPALVSLSR